MSTAFIIRFRFILILALALGVSGCDDDSDDTIPIHQPPEGQGSITIDNQTEEEINVYIDGIGVGRINDFDSQSFDQEPGVYRVVLDERGGDRTFRDDIDVMVGRLTILDVSVDPLNRQEFDVSVFFRNP